MLLGILVLLSCGSSWERLRSTLLQKSRMIMPHPDMTFPDEGTGQDSGSLGGTCHDWGRHSETRTLGLPPGRAARSTTWACTCKSFINRYCFLSSAFQGTSPSDLKLFFSYQINGYIS